MGNKKGVKRKRITRAAVKRRRNSSKKSLQCKHECSCETDYEEDTRIIISSKSIQNLINIVSLHSKHCKNPSVSITNKTSRFIKLHCKGCCSSMQIRKDSHIHQLPVTDATVAGAYHAGIGYTTIKLLFTCMEIPFMAKETFQEGELRIEKLLKRANEETFKANGKEERDLAIANGDVVEVADKSYPFISGTCDGGWMKRTYGHSYNSNAGIGVIIGSRTGKILYMDYRIKYCSICDKASPEDETEKTTVKPHNCYKNWSDSSQAMESDIIVKGFQKSIEDHDLIYKYVVGDADSSVFAKIQSQVVYPGRIPVEEVDCINHAVRGLNSKLHSLMNNTTYDKEDRDLLTKEWKRMGKDVKAAVSYNNKNQNSIEIKTSAKTLSEDIINVPAHVFGCHKNCKTYFCKSDRDTDEAFEKFKKSSLGRELMLAFHRLANRSHRIIHNTTSNFAECFMAVMTKCISGKRINYAQRGGYARRAMAAVQAYDQGSFWMKSLIGTNPEKPFPKLWNDASEYFYKSKFRGSTLKNGPFRYSVKKDTSKSNNLKKCNEEYGPNALQGRMTLEELDLGVSNLIKSLQVTPQLQQEIERLTVNQSNNERWKYERRNRLTASNCGKVFRLKDWTKNTCTLKTILYPTDLSKNENIANGINLEPVAKEVYSWFNGDEVKDCGLFISLENGIFAASPDGLIGEDGILEIKCINCPPENVPKRKDNFLIPTSKTDPTLTIRKTHRYYFQIVMQIHITGKSFCDLFVYHEPKNEEISYGHTVRIYKDESTEALWNQMKSKMEKFDVEDMAPEIVDPVFPTTSSFRTPKYRYESIQAKLALQNSKKTQSSLENQPSQVEVDLDVSALFNDDNNNLFVCENSCAA